jgi:hypothetical protein
VKAYPVADRGSGEHLLDATAGNMYEGVDGLRRGGSRWLRLRIPGVSP